MTKRSDWYVMNECEQRDKTNLLVVSEATNTTVKSMSIGRDQASSQ